MEGIPKEVRVPSQLIHRAKVPHHTAYIESTLRHVAERYGTRVVEDSSLGFPTPLSFEIGVGNQTAAIDYNDLTQLPPCAGGFDRWYKFHMTSAHVPFGNVRPFPPCSFSNWEQYRNLAADIRYGATGDTILHAQQTRIILRAQQWADDLTRRRSLVRDMLRGEYGDSVDVQQTEQTTFWKRGGGCLVSVHVPGMWANMLDRGQLQLMAFGVCTISPVLHTRIGDDVPTPGVHYIAVRDDFSDLIELIEWCRDNRDGCCQIGVEAKRLFQANCLPEAIWSRIGRETKRWA